MATDPPHLDTMYMNVNGFLKKHGNKSVHYKKSKAVPLCHAGAKGERSYSS
jgi:hypothetical protein